MTTATVEQTNKRSSRAKSQERLALALIAPTLIVLTIVIVIPVIQSVKQALYGQPGLDPETGFVNETEPFVGMKNFADIFTGSGERFWTAFWNTTLFGVVTVVLETILGVIMALIMHRAMAGRGIVRAAIGEQVHGAAGVTGAGVGFAGAAGEELFVEALLVRGLGDEEDAAVLGVGFDQT